MAVLVEAISVVVRVDAIEARFPGGWPAFVAEVPNATPCADGELARAGFMTPDDVRIFVSRLEFGSVLVGSNRVAAARLVGSKIMRGVTPDGWEWENSLSASFGFVPVSS